MASLKRSVTVDAEVLEKLSAARRSNLSAAVNEGLHLLAALDAQQEAVDLFEAEHEPIEAKELEPYLRAVIQAHATSVALRRRRGKPSKRTR